MNLVICALSSVVQILYYFRYLQNFQQMSDFTTLTEELLAFRDERNWSQFHNPKDLAIALNIETSELLEVFLWKSPDAADIEKVKAELADIFSYALLLANKYDFNVLEIVSEKIHKNAAKYPVEKARNNSKKYDEL